MPIQIVAIDRGKAHAPALFCDQCGLQIDRAHEANAEYLFARKEQIGISIVFLHKRCSKQWRTAHPDYPLDGNHWMWADLAQFLADLAHNANRTIEP